jgi:hypothetical protein
VVAADAFVDLLQYVFAFVVAADAFVVAADAFVFAADAFVDLLQVTLVWCKLRLLRSSLRLLRLIILHGSFSMRLHLSLGRCI